MKDTIEAVIKKLKEKEFHLLGYGSYTTNSYYIKMDYGVVGSLRISDHHGKKHLKYKYNLLSNLTESYIDIQGTFTRHYYTFDDVEEMINDIVSEREEKMNKWPSGVYEAFMNKNQTDSIGKKGFWSQCKVI